MNLRPNKPLSILILLSVLFSACEPNATATPQVSVEVPPSTMEPVGEIETPTPTEDMTQFLETVSGIATSQATQTPTTGAQEDRPVKAIILFIGDGMGQNQRLGAQWLALGQEELLSMDNMPVRGMMGTAAANRAITDSAASATALASGIKTNYRVVGMSPDYTPVETILEQAHARGWATGLITTVPLTHATPAAFAAHVSYRYRELEIAKQMMASGVDVLLGGGEDDFLPYGVQGCFPGNGNRVDKLNLVEQAVNTGYTLVCTGEELLGLDTQATQKLIGFFGDEEMHIPFNPTLADMTRVAIDVLSNDPDGFFLMVEGGQIDWEAEDNHALETMKLTVGLNAAVTMAQVYAVGEPNTLIIVTADHESGGMSLNLDCAGTFRQDGPFNMPDGTEFCVDWETGGHTGVDVPVTAQGPWSWMLYGEYPNTWVYRVMYAALTGEGFTGP
jgi:alkaline phosphatase